MQKLDKEISFIHDARIRNSALVLQDLLPEYFWVMPASTTGKYHPEVELGEGGLLRHSKAVTRIGYELLKIEMFRVNYTEHERDLTPLFVRQHHHQQTNFNKRRSNCQTFEGFQLTYNVTTQESLSSLHP